MRFPVGHGSYAPRLAVVGNFLGLVGLLFTGLQLWKMHSSSHRLVMRQGKPHRVVVWDFSGPAHDGELTACRAFALTLTLCENLHCRGNTSPDVDPSEPRHSSRSLS